MAGTASVELIVSLSERLYIVLVHIYSYKQWLLLFSFQHCFEPPMSFCNRNTMVFESVVYQFVVPIESLAAAFNVAHLGLRICMPTQVIFEITLWCECPSADAAFIRPLLQMGSLMHQYVGRAAKCLPTDLAILVWSPSSHLANVPSVGQPCKLMVFLTILDHDFNSILIICKLFLFFI